MRLKSSGVWKANKRRIFSNWRRYEHIRESYEFRLAAYATAYEARYMDKERFDVDIPEGTIAREIYQKA